MPAVRAVQGDCERVYHLARHRLLHSPHLETTIMVSEVYEMWPGANFTHDFSMVIQIQWKFYPTPMKVVTEWSLWNFANGTTAVLSSHVKKFVVIWNPMQWCYIKTKFPSNLNYDEKNCLWNGPLCWIMDKLQYITGSHDPWKFHFSNATDSPIGQP